MTGSHKGQWRETDTSLSDVVSAQYRARATDCRLPWNGRKVCHRTQGSKTLGRVTKFLSEAPETISKVPTSKFPFARGAGGLGKGLGHSPCPLDTHKSEVLPQNTKEKEANGVKYTWVQAPGAKTLYRCTQATQGLPRQIWASFTGQWAVTAGDSTPLPHL